MSLTSTEMQAFCMQEIRTTLHFDFNGNLSSTRWRS